MPAAKYKFYNCKRLLGQSYFNQVVDQCVLASIYKLYKWVKLVVRVMLTSISDVRELKKLCMQISNVNVFQNQIKTYRTYSRQLQHTSQPQRQVMLLIANVVSRPLIKWLPHFEVHMSTSLLIHHRRAVLLLIKPRQTKLKPKLNYAVLHLP